MPLLHNDRSDHLPGAFVTRRCRCRADAYAHTPKVKLFVGRLCASYKEWVG